MPALHDLLSSMSTLIVVIAVVVFALILFNKMIRVVPAHHADVVERLGRYHGTLRAGTHVLMPFTDRVARRYPLGDQVAAVSTSSVSRDNQTAEISGTVRYQIVDPERAHYSVPDIQLSVAQVMARCIRDEAGRRSQDALRSEQREFRAAVVREADATVKEFGAKVLDCDLTLR